MNRNITLLAFGAKCGGFGASGLANAPAAPSFASAPRALPPKKPSPESSPARATPVNPAPASQRNSRRVRWQKVPAGVVGSEEGRFRFMRGPLRFRWARAIHDSIEVNELVEIQHHEAEALEGR